MGLGLFVIGYNFDFEALYHRVFFVESCLNSIIAIFPYKSQFVNLIHG